MAQTEINWDQQIPLPKLSPFHAKIAVALVALLCFINSYDGDFVFDDSEAIINNKDLIPSTPLNNIWRNDFWGSNLSSNNSHKSYRPLTVLTFRLNYLIAGGLHPVGFHVLNIGLHSLISALMIDMFSVLIGGLAYDGNGNRLNHAPKASLLAGLLFAAHPVHTESVAGIVGRADLLCALFFQLSFLTYCKAFRGGRESEEKFSIHWIAVSLLLCAAAMLCKEQGITVLGVNAAFDVLLICNVNVYELSQRLFLRRKAEDVSERVRTGLLIRLALLAMGGASMLYARWRIMGTGPPAFTEVDNPASFADNVFLRIVNYNYYYSLNAWVLLCPWWLCFDWSMGCVPLIKSAFDWRTAWLLLLWCFLIGLISQALCSQDSQRRRTLTLGLVLLVVPFLPACNIFFRVGFVIAERVLYLSSAGYCLLLAYALGHCCGRWSRCKGLLRASLLALLCVYVARCALRSHQWRSEQSLFTSALSVCPLNAKVHYNVGKNLADRGNTSAAIKYYREAVRLHPTYVHAMNNLGNILKERNELVEAEELLAKAVLVQPDFAAAWMNLGIVQNSLKKFKEAEQSYWNAIQFRKKYPDCYYNLGRLYADLNRHLDALNAWRNATVLKPDHSLAWNNMVILLDNTGNLAQAEAIGREALKLLPNDHTIMFSLANVLGKLQKYKESEGFFLQALRINPNAASCHGNLAVLYHRWGKLELAKKHYELSLKLDPVAPGTRDNYNMLRRKLDQLYRTTPP
ncbi:protein O-mannosyl-transferase TMTC4 isoform X1 [Oncorhynchus tshawytscha]|uniref:dolichyl-phosphate-mannose--protein mannosyltransferase n=1 Tax=Oncorhynchus tshawytscha TaxID=74940 RepID=A0A8C8K781_ONCTS|nr:protein O-mannosyl-transferase TMTC4 isoform X1 [Oncorhynchus tshawytscha]XP_024244429.1 protein O-mannosyl-transferase TMTC4 isoform X1 [Oncorhynchus tshawytscha]